MMQGYRRVAIVETFYNVLEQIHNKVSQHAGSKKTYAKVVMHFCEGSWDLLVISYVSVTFSCA